MKGIRLLLAASAMFCLTHGVYAASAMKVKMAEVYLKNAEGGGFTAKSAAKEARQRIDALKKEYGADDPDVQALEKRLLVIENKDKAAQEEKAAQQKAEQQKAENEKKDAEKANAEKQPPAVIGHTAPKPWVLETDYEAWNDKHPVNKYIKNLGKEKKEDVLELDKQLRARIEEDRKIVAANGNGQTEAEQEIERYKGFLSALETVVNINSDIKIDVEKKRMDFYYFKVFFSNFSRDIRNFKKDGKPYFFGLNGEPEYIREKEIPYAQEARMTMAYINIFCANQGSDRFMQVQSKAAVCAMNTEKAIKNNSPDVVIFHPVEQFPKGEMHNELAKEALKVAIPARENVVDVIINSNDWGIERNALGIIILRVCAGWVVVKDDLGKRVIPAKWCQPNQGGDSYGKLQLLSCGGNSQYYIK